jgi:hypothetical protein
MGADRVTKNLLGQELGLDAMRGARRDDRAA